MARKIRIPIRWEFTWTLTCPYCRRGFTVKLRPGQRRTVYCPCGRMKWHL